MGLKFSEDHLIRLRQKITMISLGRSSLWFMLAAKKTRPPATPGGSTMTDPKMGLFVRLPKFWPFNGGNN
jgi:hypothetical protein